MSASSRLSASAFTLGVFASLALWSAPGYADDLPPVEAVQNAPDGYRCPGDNVAFWEEIKEAGWVGFGETWDFWTCDEGADLFAEGANRGWRKMRPRRARPRLRLPGLSTAEEVRMYTTAIPYLAFGPLALIFLFAWAFAWFMRRRFTPPQTVTCPDCTTEMPIRVDEGGAFCPRCGAPMVLEEQAKA